MRITMDLIRKHLCVNKHRLDDELEIQSQMLHDISEELAEANVKMLGLKESLEVLEAELQQDYRRGDTKKTVAEVNAEILLDSSRQDCHRKYLEAKKEYERWLGLYEAWKQRGYTMKTLSELYTANYFSVDSTGRATDYAANRKVAAEARSQSTEAPTTRRRKLVD